MARAALRDDLHAVHAQLTAEVLTSLNGHRASTAPAAPLDLVRSWQHSNPGVADSVKTLRSVTAGRPDLARMSVGLRLVRGLLPAAG